MGDRIDTAADRSLWAEVDIRVIDQRIGAGVGGFDTVIRVLHRPTGIIIEMPRLTSSQYTDRAAAMAALEMALEHVWEDKGGLKK